jgi:hypothetical protein
MLVRDQNAGQILRRATNGSQAFADLPLAETTINKNAAFVGLQIGTIA